MGNNTLIKGAGVMAERYADAGESFGEGYKTASRRSKSSDSSWGAVPQTVRDNDRYQETVNRHMNDMKTDMDLTAFSESETAAIRNFLLAERNKYAEAAKRVATIDDRTSSEYLSLVDTMNGVNNSFVNLSKQLQAYKKNKIEYAEDQLSNSLSKGMDPEQNRQAMIMYGFYDANKDKKSDSNYDAPFQILDKGNLGFNIDGKTISYNEVSAPVYKDYKLANSILKANESVFKSGQPMNKMESDMYRLKLEEALQDPNSLRSIVYDFDSELGMRDIGNIWDSNKNKDGAVEEVRSMVINRLLKARADVASEGAAEKERKKAASKKSSGRSGSGSGASEGQSDYAPPAKGADGKWYSYKIGKNGLAAGQKFEVPAPAGQATAPVAKETPAKAPKKEVKKESPGVFSREYWLGKK
jgi:hypothetical protein